MATRFLVLLLAGLVAASCTSTPRTAPRESAPGPRTPLVVVLVVDQMGSEYLETLGPRFTGGFRRILDEGAWFRNAAYPYLNTITCAGHATIGTGALPYRHGMVLNAWWDRAAARSNPCTSDPSARSIAYMGTATGGDSAEALLAPTLAEQLKTSTGGRTAALSLKPRSAITMAGRNPDAVLWFDERSGWATSSAFTATTVPWIQDYISANPVSAYMGKAWERLLPISAYAGEDEVPAERTPSGWTRVFPHVLGEPAGQLLLHFQRSPDADEYLGRLAALAIDRLDLGRGTGTDFISVSFSTLDLVGHQYGPASHETQDVLFRLDRTIGALLDHLDARLGRDGYVLALSADHGVAPLPELSGGQRQPSAEIVAKIDATLAPFFGPGKYVAHTAYTDIYLAPGILDRVRKSPEAKAALIDALEGMTGIAHAFLADDVKDPALRKGTDPVKRAAALSYYEPRSGDILVVPERNWILSTAATTHGTLYPYDQRVPVIFFGRGVTPGVHEGAASPADIAPTLAALVGARVKPADGVALIRR
ncbi:MAG: alkaline phosphatase family protein [Acidobacteriota bacterium]|nr:alkaline phosphatase family protein [Acidobacteriota bacterium]